MAETEFPARIGRYTVAGVIGRGAMGVIYRAHDPAIDRAVALKLIRADLLEGQERADYLERFQREAQAAGRCAHPNIVAVYDFALHEGNPFIAMEFVQGLSLAQALAGGRRFTPAQAVDVTLQLLAALACAHGFGVVHRDIKPANLLLRDGSIKVTDFGISRLDSSHLTQDGSVMGTPSYMSPEQCRGDTVDPRSDLFSAAAILYEMLTGERPFPGRGFTDISYHVVNEPARPLAALAPAAPPSLQAVLDRALAKQPTERFASADEMAAALRQAMQDELPVSSDGTVVTPRALRAPSGEGLLDQAVIAEIERKLARYVGPIARYLVQGARGKAESVEEFCAALALTVEPAEARNRFLDEALGPLRARTGATLTPVAAGVVTMGAAKSTPIAADEVERAQRELGRHIGPIAKILVKRALEAAHTPQELWDLLSMHIERPADRDAFLRQRPR